MVNNTTAANTVEMVDVASPKSGEMGMMPTHDPYLFEDLIQPFTECPEYNS